MTVSPTFGGRFMHVFFSRNAPVRYMAYYAQGGPFEDFTGGEATNSCYAYEAQAGPRVGVWARSTLRCDADVTTALGVT